jgi:hypothetical protein
MTFQVPWKLVLMSAVVGILAPIALGGLAFAEEPHFDAVGVYFAPARLTIFVVGPLIPSRLVYWLVPDGDAPAGLFLTLVSAILFWSILFGAIYFTWATSKRRRAAPTSVKS